MNIAKALRRNLHSHTYRCKHATGDALDYVSAAHECGADTYGISDHTPLPKDRFNNVRMALAELDGYQQAVEDARLRFTDMTVLMGLECEDFKDARSFYQDEILGERQFDYLIGAGHYTPINGKWEDSYSGMSNAAKLRAYSAHLCEMMESDLYSFIAHPDVFGLSNKSWTEDLTACTHDILAAAEACNKPIEVNGGGFRKQAANKTKGIPGYPWGQFWAIASDYQITVICNSDAHHPEHALANIDDALEFCQTHGLSLADDEQLGIAHRLNQGESAMFSAPG